VVAGAAGGGTAAGRLGAVGSACTGTGGASIGALPGWLGVVRRVSSQRGIEVTVQKDDGQTVTIAQADNGDVQMGDWVRVVQDRNGVPVVVRDQGVRRDL